MTMLAEMHGSVAFMALSKFATRALSYIERAIDAGGDGVVISHDDFALDARIARDEIAPAIREIVALGFVVAGTDDARRKTFSRSFRWRNVTSTAEAVQLCAAAGLPLPKRAPAPRNTPAPAPDAEERRQLRRTERGRSRCRKLPPP